MLRVRRCSRAEVILQLDEEVFPADPRPDVSRGAWWVAWQDGEPVGYAGARLDAEGNCYFPRCGVLKHARGQGLQQRFIQARLRWAREQGCQTAYTYTLIDRCPSSNSLVRAGFRLYRPEWLYVGQNVNYWRKAL